MPKEKSEIAEILKYPRFTPSQQDAISKILEQAMKNLGPASQTPDLGNLGKISQTLLGNLPSASFEPIEKRYMDLFQTQILPQLANQFTAAGGDTRLGSSPYTQALAGAGTDLASQLAALRSQHQLQQFGQMGQLGLGVGNLALNRAQQQGGIFQNLAALGLQPKFGTAIQPQAPSFASSFGAGLGQGLGSLGGSLLKMLTFGMLG